MTEKRSISFTDVFYVKVSKTRVQILTTCKKSTFTTGSLRQANLETLMRLFRIFVKKQNNGSDRIASLRNDQRQRSTAALLYGLCKHQ